jgi:hypothetical protein
MLDTSLTDSDRLEIGKIYVKSDKICIHVCESNHWKSSEFCRSLQIMKMLSE